MNCGGVKRPTKTLVGFNRYGKAKAPQRPKNTEVERFTKASIFTRGEGSDGGRTIINN